MDDKRLERVIAREGLIILCCAIAFLLFLFRAARTKTFFENPVLMIFLYGLPIFLLYVIYWIIRFIIWAVRTLRKK